MDFIPILITVLIMALIGLLLGLLLAVAGKVFAVKKDDRIDKIREALPGANCGGCGFAGCSDYADSIVTKNAPTNKCPVGGDKVAADVSAIMGIDVTKTVRKRAQVMCSGTTSLANRKYNYLGLEDCLSVAKLGNGPKECSYGCIGLGSCVKACVFNAIKVENGVAVVEYEKCVACGMCVTSCPQKIIKLIPFNTDIWTGCSSKDKGPVVRSLCKVGCIGCSLCTKVCPTGAITVENSVVSIDYDKCTNCGACVEKCPRKIIWSGKKQIVTGDTIEHAEEETVRPINKNDVMDHNLVKDIFSEKENQNSKKSKRAKIKHKNL